MEQYDPFDDHEVQPEAQTPADTLIDLIRGDISDQRLPQPSLSFGWEGSVARTHEDFGKDIGDGDILEYTFLVKDDAVEVHHVKAETAARGNRELTKEEKVNLRPKTNRQVYSNIAAK